MGLGIEVPIIRRHLHLSDPMIRVRRTRGESQERGRVLVVGRRCQCCVSSAYLAWLAKVMKDQCIHLLCTLQCAAPCLAGWHTLKDQQSNHLALARCRLRHGWSQTREVLESLRHSFQYHFSWRVGACPVCWHSSLNLYHLQPDKGLSRTGLHTDHII